MDVQAQYCSCFRDGGKFNSTLYSRWLMDEEEMNTNTVNIDNAYLVLICSDTTYGHAIWYGCTTNGK